MSHDQQVGQASNQATEVGRVGAGLPPRRTDPGQGIPEQGAMRFTSHVTEADRHQPCQPAPGQTHPESQALPLPFRICEV